MSEVSWQMDDPILQSITYEKDAAGFWTVSVELQEVHPGSLTKKVVNAKLKAFGQDVAQSLWPVSGSRQEGQAANTTLTFQTGSAKYPRRARVVVAPTEK